MSVVQVRPAALRKLGALLLQAAGSSPREAELVAANLVDSNLCGHDSHGIGYLPGYLRTAKAGNLVPNQTPKIIHDSGPVIVLDGGMGYGQVMGREAMQRGIARTKELGACTVSLRNSHHLGRIGFWAGMCSRAGLASTHFVNVAGHDPLVAPFGGADARLGTNPVAASFPTARSDLQPLCLDMATSKIALGKARNAFNAGDPLPPAMVIDCDGEPSTDPGVMFPKDPSRKGALTPAGEHKGFGLAVVAEVFGAVATGGRTMAPHHPRPPAITNSMLTHIFDPAVTSGLGQGGQVEMDEEVALLCDYVKASPRGRGLDPETPDVMIPGERAAGNRTDRALQLELDAGTWEELVQAGALVGVDQRAFDDALRGGD